jgi:threonine aldolase
VTMSPIFASDNASGVHPHIMEALVEANKGHALGYGADPYTPKVNQAFKKLFGDQAETFLVYNGTGSNVIALKGLVRSYEAIFCSVESHLWIDEAGAPEQFLGSKLITIPSYDGKIRIADIQPRLIDIGFQHRSQPRVISIAQCTERGSVYSRDELKEICEFAKQHGFYVHIDGSRIHNALAALNTDCKSLFTDLGVDVVSFGGTKNGLMVGEAVVVLNPELQADYAVIRKHGMHLASKMRFLAAQFLAYFKNDLWLQNAANANAMARYMAEQLATVAEARLVAPVESNILFVELPNHWIELLQKQAFFHVWKANSSEGRSEGRFVMSFDIIKQDIDSFIEYMRQLTAR